MSHSAATPTKNLPMFEDDDKPSWLGDFNEAMTKIDTAFSAQEALIVALQNRCSALEARVTTLETAGA